ncbi:hypothetical protein BDR26DRAFT_1008371 [Obelidium mucronatum]|nr:hypothetical protein BDR26DRAFT_1008371 [Obelidium mucronatum]
MSETDQLRQALEHFEQARLADCRAALLPLLARTDSDRIRSLASVLLLRAHGGDGGGGDAWAAVRGAWGRGRVPAAAAAAAVYGVAQQAGDWRAARAFVGANAGAIGTGEAQKLLDWIQTLEDDENKHCADGEGGPRKVAKDITKTDASDSFRNKSVTTSKKAANTKIMPSKAAKLPAPLADIDKMVSPDPQDISKHPIVSDQSLNLQPTVPLGNSTPEPDTKGVSKPSPRRLSTVKLILRYIKAHSTTLFTFAVSLLAYLVYHHRDGPAAKKLFEWMQRFLKTLQMASSL